MVVTSHNRLAVQAAQAVVQGSGADLNPLLLYGESGVGKTHLLTAIAAAADVLTIDDADRLPPGQARRLLDAAGGRPVVVAARRLDDDLRALVLPGFAAAIQPPDAETRRVIMRQATGVSEDVARLITQRGDLSLGDQLHLVRQAQRRSRLSGAPLSPGLVATVLQELAPAPAVPAHIDRIVQVVADHYGVRPADLRGTSRSRALAEARHVAIFLCRELTHRSLPEVGAAFGGRDATTVMHSERKVRRLVAVRDDLNSRIAAISAELRR